MDRPGFLAMAQAVDIAPNYVEERIDHLRLQLWRNPANHAEVEEGKVPRIHHQ